MEYSDFYWEWKLGLKEGVMAKFGRASNRRLLTCDDRLQRLMRRVVQIMDTTILEGERSQEDQDRYVELGYSTIKYPHGKHNLTIRDKSMGKKSQAVDAGPYPVIWPDKEKRPDTYVKDLGRWYMWIGVVRAVADEMEIPIRCGADWDGDWEINDQNFDDLPHVELAEDFEFNNR